MKHGIGLGLALAVCGLVQAEEPAPASSAPTSSAPAAPAPATTPAPTSKPLNLRIGDIRKYMTPEEFRALITPPDEADTVIVQGRALVPMRSELDVPGGIIAPFWALANPHKAWRLFLPDPRIDITKIPPPESKIPAPIFRWGP